MKFAKLVGLTILLFSFTFTQNSYQVYFNEIRADDASTDDNEFIELIGPAGTDITGLIIVHYNGAASSDGGLWSHTIGSFTIPDDCAGKGFYTYGSEGNGYDDASGWSGGGRLQNGEDGLILYDTDGITILDAIAWQGSGDITTDDPGTVTTIGLTTANNYLHVTIDDDNHDNSLNAPNNVVGDNGTGWILATATPGAINSGQTACGDITLPVELSFFSAKETVEGVHLTWRTESEFENIGFLIERKTKNTDWSEIISYKDDNALLGQGTVSYPTDYDYIDRFVEKGEKYSYRLADVDQNGVITYHQSESILVDSNPLSTAPDKLSISTYPNPFNPTINILYSVANMDNNQLTSVSIDIYNIRGELIASLLEKDQSQGWHSIQWSGLDNSGNEVPGGTYFCQIKAGKEIRNNKIVYLK